MFRKKRITKINPATHLIYIFIILVMSYTTQWLFWFSSLTYTLISHFCSNLFRSSDASSERCVFLPLITLLLPFHLPYFFCPVFLFSITLFNSPLLLWLVPSVKFVWEQSLNVWWRWERHEGWSLGPRQLSRGRNICNGGSHSGPQQLSARFRRISQLRSSWVVAQL